MPSGATGPISPRTHLNRFDAAGGMSPHERRATSHHQPTPPPPSHRRETHDATSHTAGSHTAGSHTAGSHHHHHHRTHEQRDHGGDRATGAAPSLRLRCDNASPTNAALQPPPPLYGQHGATPLAVRPADRAVRGDYPVRLSPRGDISPRVQREGVREVLFTPVEEHPPPPAANHDAVCYGTGDEEHDAAGAAAAPAAAAAAAPAASEAAHKPPPPRPHVPPIVQAAYSIDSMLGAGAFGTVWMATSRESGEKCAIKIVERQRQLHEDFSLEPAEVEIFKMVHHQNIVKLIDLISTEACVYLVMELVLCGHLQASHLPTSPHISPLRPPSPTFSHLLSAPLASSLHLQARLKTHGAYDEPRARIIIRQVVAAATHLHERHIIHRDIKPENILFSSVGGDGDGCGDGDDDADSAASCDGGVGGGGGSSPRERGLEVKLTDFGLSTVKEGRLTTRCGTPSYCAPELLSGAGYGKAVDIWSLGVLTYVVLTNQLPFVGRDRSDLFARIQRGQYTYPPRPHAGTTHTHAVDIDTPLSPTSDMARDLISRLLKLEPMERYSTRETLQHPWLAEHHDGAHGDDGPTDLTDVDPDSLGTVHEMMRRFIAEERLKKAVLVVIACGRFRRAGKGWDDPIPDEAGEDAPPVE